MAMNELGPEHFAKLFPTLKVKNRISNGLEETWSAWDQRLERPVGLKVYRLERQDYWQNLGKLRSDIWALSKFKHPAVPTVFEERESEIDGYNLYMVLEHFEGPSLEYWQARTESEIEAIAEEVLLILHEMHAGQTPLVHRNITPANIVQTDEGLKLVNFGALHLLQPRTPEAELIWQQFHASQWYGGEEHVRSSPRSDFYGLGLTMVFLLTGENPSDLEFKHGRIQWEEHSKIEVSAHLKFWVNRCLEADLDKRFFDTSHAIAALRKHWTDGMVKLYDRGLLKVETPPSQLIIRSRDVRPETFAMQIGFFVAGGLVGIWFWTINWLVSLSCFAIAIVSLIWTGVDLFRKDMELVISRGGWVLTVNGKNIGYGPLQRLEGITSRYTNGGTMLAIKEISGRELVSEVEVDELEVEGVNQLIEQFKKSQK